MTRVDITETVVAQLAELLDSGELDQPTNWMGTQFLAQDFGFEELATFVFEADAATYYEAVQRAEKQAEINIELP